MKHHTCICLVALAATACGWQPARFADRPPVSVVHDDRPISMPRKGAFLEELYQADVYVRRELVSGLDPRDYPEALDVNSFDEVPTSSWFRNMVDQPHPLVGYGRDGPPQPPWTLTGEPPESGTPEATSIIDKRGLSYELQEDLPQREGMRTGATAIASRLLHALGYRTPEVHIVRSHTGTRVAATRWPIGVDLGPTPINHRRDDDPNDHLPHVDRRSLRALKLVTAWLGISKMRPRMLRDAFIAKEARGHVQHFMVGLDSSLGVEDFLRAVAFAANEDREQANFFLRLSSLGLSPKPPAIMPETPWPSVGWFNPQIDPATLEPSPPFEPIDRLQPGDLYWIAKRIGAVPHGTVAEAITAAKLDPGPTNWLLQVLHLRRAAIVAWGYDRTTPCEVVSLDQQHDSAYLVLKDLAVEHGFVEPSERSYEVTFFGADGDEIAGGLELNATSANVRVPLPRVITEVPYSIARVLAKRDGNALPRTVDIHFRPSVEGLRIAGLRH